MDCILLWALRHLLVKKDAKMIIKAGGKMNFWNRFMMCTLYVIQNKERGSVLSRQTMLVFYPLTMESINTFKDILWSEIDGIGAKKEIKKYV